MTQPQPGYLAAQPGHPEPEPIPEPEPPQPIPPPDPAPQPEPPHASGGADFIDAGPPTTDLEWPPVGSYPGEPGFRDQPTPAPFSSPGSDVEQATEAIPVMVDRTQLIGDQTQPIETGWQAWEHSPAAGSRASQDRSTLAAPPPWEVPLPPIEPERGRQRRSGLWLSLVLAITLVLCGGGATSAYLLLRNADSGRGAPDPATAVNRFMTAVYSEQDASAAAGLVCREARDESKLKARVNQIKSYESAYDQPAFRWSDPVVSGQNDERAMVNVQLTMSTDDEKQALQELTFTVVHKTGWQVCDIVG